MLPSFFWTSSYLIITSSSAITSFLFSSLVISYPRSDLTEKNLFCLFFFLLTITITHTKSACEGNYFIFYQSLQRFRKQCLEKNKAFLGTKIHTHYHISSLSFFLALQLPHQFSMPVKNFLFCAFSPLYFFCYLRYATFSFCYAADWVRAYFFVFLPNSCINWSDSDTVLFPSSFIYSNHATC